MVDDTSGLPASSSEVANALSRALEDVARGAMPRHMLLRIARTHDREGVRFCLARLEDPEISHAEEALLGRVLQESRMVQALVDQVAAASAPAGEIIDRVFLSAARQGAPSPPAEGAAASDARVILQALAAVESAGDPTRLVPLLLALLATRSPEAQSAAAGLLARLDTAGRYTERLARHQAARVRANLEAEGFGASR